MPSKLYDHDFKRNQVEGGMFCIVEGCGQLMRFHYNIEVPLTHKEAHYYKEGLISLGQSLAARGMLAEMLGTESDEIIQTVEPIFEVLDDLLQKLTSQMDPFCRERARNRLLHEEFNLDEPFD